MPITAIDLAPPAIYRLVRRKDESVTHSDGDLDRDRHEIVKRLGQSAFWPGLMPFLEARDRLHEETALASGNPHYLEPPNAVALFVASRVLNILEAKLLPLGRVSATTDGGIALLFIAKANRAIIQIGNEGEIVAATYTASGDPAVWQVPVSDERIAIVADQIRVHLAA